MHEGWGLQVVDAGRHRSATGSTVTVGWITTANASAQAARIPIAAASSRAEGSMRTVPLVVTTTGIAR